MPNAVPLADLSPDDRFGIVVARWNEAITGKLLDGAVDTLRQHGVADEAIDVAWVPLALPVQNQLRQGTGGASGTRSSKHSLFECRIDNDWGAMATARSGHVSTAER